jgi:hypothetical protein
MLENKSNTALCPELGKYCRSSRTDVSAYIKDIADFVNVQRLSKNTVLLVECSRPCKSTLTQPKEGNHETGWQKVIVGLSQPSGEQFH